MQLSNVLKSFAKPASRSSGHALRIGYTDGVLSAREVASMSSLFPKASFEPVGNSLLQVMDSSLRILIVGLDAQSALETEQVITFIEKCPASLNILVALRNADVASTRALARAGAGDVISLPANDASWALSIERLLAKHPAHGNSGGRTGEIVALLKAGGGVGATSLGVQSALSLARQGTGGICFADLDLQFGAAALYFDLSEALTVTDCVAVGEMLEETQFATALAAHKSGVHVLAAPRDVTPLETLNPKIIDALLGGLKRDFALTLLDLPSAWTAWTNRALHLCDRIVLVTNLSVAHVHLVRRQLAVLALQNLNNVPLTLVCNAASSERQGLLSIKAAEKAIGRSFDLVLPYEARLMNNASNQGLALADIQKGSKLEKLVETLSARIAANTHAASAAGR